ncbi:uncharacterized protein [Halyomorpha halys]|uniref:uncharacterized protein n=1 Tax=Halyomorpha halys TaxID=286706 RepID=UPI0006D4E9B4|nr:uncharacterized protein LOC106686776 [Halyomorpha halys]
MGFLLGLEHANLTMMSSTSRNGSQASSRKSSLGVGDVSNGSVSGKVNHHGPNHDNGQNYHLNVTHNSSEVWMKEKEVSDIQCRLQPQFCDDCHNCSNSHDSEIGQRLKRTLSKFKISLGKSHKPTSEVVTGLRYSVDFDATDEASGRSFSSGAINSLGHRSSQDSSILNFKTVQRASF